MTDTPSQAMALVREALSRYTDTPPQDMQPETLLADLQVDSLTLAELLFELEDKVGKSIGDTTQVPQTIADVIALVQPALDA